MGISGDIAPLDYIAADGKPAGYSLEVLSEISRRAGYNFEIVSMANEAKFTALAAGKIDLFFFHMLSSDIQATADTAAANPNIAFSEPYYTFSGTFFLVRK